MQYYKMDINFNYIAVNSFRKLETNFLRKISHQSFEGARWCYPKITQYHTPVANEKISTFYFRYRSWHCTRLLL